MPLTKKGKKIMANMKAEYGSKQGKKVFYASKNAGKIKGVDKGFFGHYSVPSANIVSNPSTTMSRKQDSFMGKAANNNIVGPVGMGAKIAGSGQGKV